MRKVFFSLFIFSLILSGCASIVPGEKKAVERNIDEEYFSIAETYFDLENYSKAIEFYEKVLWDKKLYDYAFYKIALCNAYLKNWDEARISFRKLLKKDKDNMSLKLSLSYIEAMNGNLSKAEKMYRLISEENPDDVEPIKNLVSVLVSRKKYNEAKETLSFIEEKFPDDEDIPEMKNKIDSLMNSKKKVKGSEAQEEDLNESLDEDLFGIEEEDKEEK